MSSSHHEESNWRTIGGISRLIIVLALGLLAALIWYTCGKPLADHTATSEHGEEHATAATTGEPAHETTAAASAIAGKVDTATGDFVYELGKLVSIELPDNGGKLEVGEYSTENKLYQFLSDKNATLDTVKGNWFEFTNVKFKTGGAVIDSSSLVQVKNIAAIAKAFPTAQFKVGGYTDNTGDAAKNIALSQKRAEAVLAAFIKQGVSTTAFTGAKGYGPEHPIGDNATAEGRAQNRRVAVNVKAK